MEMFKGKNIFVTGACGSIGSEIVKNLLKYDVNKIYAFDIDEIKQFMSQQVLDDDRIEFLTGNVCNLDTLKRCFSLDKVDIVYHAAAMKHVVICEQSPMESVRNNVIGTQNVVDSALRHDVKRMINISTDKAASPVNVMGASKFITERITLNANKITDSSRVFSCVRFGNVANTRGSIIPVLVENIRKGNTLKLTDPNVTRFIMGINDTINLIFKATEVAQGGEIFILKMKAFKLGDLFDVFRDKISLKFSTQPEDITIKETGLIFGEKLHEDLINNIELNNLYERDDMYVVLPPSRTSTITKAKLSSYSSEDVELISKDELEKYVLDYLKTSRLV
ncbi:SDR family NAD(P)-dependent oxidoreductase [Candidatus Aenigmatarchaeota archaeon]